MSGARCFWCNHVYKYMYLACRRTTSWRCTRRAVELVLRRSSRTGLATIQSDWSCDDPVGLVLRRSSRTGRATIQSDWSCDDPVGLVLRRSSRTSPATIQSDWSCDDPVGLVLRRSRSCSRYFAGPAKTRDLQQTT